MKSVTRLLLLVQGLVDSDLALLLLVALVGEGHAFTVARFVASPSWWITFAASCSTTPVPRLVLPGSRCSHLIRWRFGCHPLRLLIIFWPLLLLLLLESSTTRRFWERFLLFLELTISTVRVWSCLSFAVGACHCAFRGQSYNPLIPPSPSSCRPTILSSSRD